MTTKTQEKPPMLPRRVFVFPVLLACLALTALSLSAADAKRPNILFCFADDWGRIASILAEIEKQPSVNQVVKTPNIDRVAREGVLFKNAFVTAPSCTPCRSSLLSGRYFFQTGQGAILQGAKWDESIPVYPLLLRDAGYHIGKMYKVWSPGTPVDAPYGGQKYAYEKSGRRVNQFSQVVTKLVAGGAAVDAAKQQLYDEVGQNFDAFLKARPAGAPFCFWFGPTNVHRKWEKGSGEKLWNISPDAMKGKLPKFLPDVDAVREDIGSYLGEIQAFDACVGVLLKRLEDAGELENTVVVVSGDHGPPGFPGGKCNLTTFGTSVMLAVRWPGQKSGRVVDDFVNLMDLAPTFLEIGGVAKPQGMVARSFVDVLKSDKSGQVDPTRTWVVTGRERHVASAREGNLPYPHRAIRTKDFLYIRNFEPERYPMGDPLNLTPTSAPAEKDLENDTFVTFRDMDASPSKAWLVLQRNEKQWQWHYDYAFGKRPADELYDLRDDRDEVVNVAGDTAYAEKLAELRGQLMKVLKENNDPRVTGAGDTFEKAPFTDSK
jgi:N-sulfoglucosamine sulfohydrolase